MVGLPQKQGLYDPQNEHDACGIGFVVNSKGEQSHEIISKGLQILINLTHRGACGCDPQTGDGAGILIQIPHKFFARECEALGFTLPPPGEYGVGMVFLPVEPSHRLIAEGILERIAREEGLSVLGWRDTPLNTDAIGRVARASQPYIEQIFIRGGPGMSEDELERKLYVVRKRAESELRRLSTSLLHMRDEEQRRIARELHDSAGQNLAALAMNLDWIKKQGESLDPRTRDVLAESEEIVGATTEKFTTADVPPPGDGVNTVTATWPTEAMSAEEIVVLSCVGPR
jgi:hypothetical protein